MPHHNVVILNDISSQLISADGLIPLPTMLIPLSSSRVVTPSMRALLEMNWGHNASSGILPCKSWQAIFYGLAAATAMSLDE